jgi:hypothetical protein
VRVSTQLWRMFNCWRVFFLLFKFAIYLTFSVLDLFDVCDFDLLDLFLSSFYLGLRKVYPYYFTFTTFTKGRWVGEKILDVFAREFRAHPVEEYVSHFWFTVIKVVVEFEMWEIRSALFYFIFLFFLIFFFIIVNRRDSVDGGNWNQV